MYSAKEGKIGIIQNFYSPNYVVCLVTISFVVFITFILTSITIVSTNCKLHVLFLIRNWFIKNEYYTGRKIKKL